MEQLGHGGPVGARRCKGYASLLSEAEPVSDDAVLSMMHFQEQLEKMCWQQGNRQQTAPAQRMADLLIIALAMISLPAAMLQA